MKNNRIILNLAVIFFSVTNGFSQNVNWISSTEKQPWKTKKAIKVNEADAATAVRPTAAHAALLAAVNPDAKSARLVAPSDADI